MKPSDKLTTTVSTKGQVVLPNAIRRKRRWEAGTELTVEDTADGVLLKAAPLFARTRAKDVYGVLPAPARARTLDEMAAGIVAEARRRHARNRY